MFVFVLFPEADQSHGGALRTHRLPGQQRRLAWVFVLHIWWWCHFKKGIYSLFVCLFFPSDPPHKPTDETTAEEFRDLLNLNLVSYFLASKVRFLCVYRQFKENFCCKYLLLLSLIIKKTSWQHDGSVVRTGDTQQEGPGFDPLFPPTDQKRVQ